MTDTQSIIEKIQKLLALADAAGSEGEAKAALSAADALMQKHRLSASDVATEGEAIGEGECLIEPSSRVVHWRMTLRGFLAAALQIHPIMVTQPASAQARGVKLRVRLFGRPSDIALFKLTYARACFVIETWTRRNAQGRGKSYAVAYSKGMAYEIGTAAVAKFAQAKEHAPSQAIVLVRVGELAKDFARSAVPNTTEHSVSNKGSLEGFEAGRKDGKRAHLGEELGDKTRGLLGS